MKTPVKFRLIQMHKILLAGIAALSVLGISAAQEAASAELFCAKPEVANRADGTVGFFNVRERPDTKGKIITRVRGLDLVWLDIDLHEYPTYEWRLIYSITREGFEMGEG
jgi:hypothetical protein